VLSKLKIYSMLLDDKMFTRGIDGDFYPPKLWNSFSAAHLFMIGYFSESLTYNNYRNVLHSRKPSTSTCYQLNYTKWMQSFKLINMKLNCRYAFDSVVLIILLLFSAYRVKPTLAIISYIL